MRQGGEHHDVPELPNLLLISGEGESFPFWSQHLLSWPDCSAAKRPKSKRYFTMRKSLLVINSAPFKLYWKLLGLSLIERKRKVSVTKSCLTLCNPVDCSPPGFSVYEILQGRILEWVAILFSRASSQPRDGARVLR